MFRKKSIGDSSLKKFDTETMRNPVDMIVEIIFFLSILSILINLLKTILHPKLQIVLAEGRSSSCCTSPKTSSSTRYCSNNR